VIVLLLAPEYKISASGLRARALTGDFFASSRVVISVWVARRFE
jgi:hypothetical protein